LWGQPQPRNLDLFLLIGQSNMAGRGVVEAQDTQPVPGIYALDKDLVWKPAVDPIHFDKPIAGVGLGRSFAITLQKLEPGASIGLIPAAVGGSSLDEWTPGGKYFNEALRRAKAAGKAGRLRGILWHQGEADSSKEELARSYQERFAKLVAALRAELGDVPVVAGQLGRFCKYPFAAVVNEQLATAPLTIPRIGFVSSEGLNHKGDDLHFDAASQREFGRRYAIGFVSLDATWGVPRVPGVAIDHSPQGSGKYIGSPSIAILPNGDYVASHDFFGPQSGFEKSAVSRVFRSQDRGAHWTRIAELQGAFWGTLFVHRGQLYWIGTHHEYGDALIRRSGDGGATWTDPVALLPGRYHCAPQPVLVHAGRIWRAFEDIEAGGGWGKQFRALMLSAPVDADLLKPASWTASNAVGPGPFGGWLEGNAVASPSGDVLDVLRVDTKEDGKAALVRISPDGKTAAAGDLIDLPGGAKKFTIRFDAESKRYWSLTNYVPPRYGGLPAGSVRNTLALISSADLRSWTVHRIELFHPDPARHGFQYVDWQFDGNDLAAVVRVAFDDEEGGAHNAHDANFLTFVRVRDFRQPN
jgi:hypothetical protein